MIEYILTFISYSDFELFDNISKAQLELSFPLLSLLWSSSVADVSACRQEEEVAYPDVPVGFGIPVQF